MKQSNQIDVALVMTKIIDFLTLSMCQTIAKRLICIILFLALVSDHEISRIVGVSLKTIRKLKIDIALGKFKDIFVVRIRGRKSKLADIDKEIIAEINANNYFSRKQIVEMIKEKFGINTSLSAVGRFLKKHNIKCLKCGSLPAKADAVKQRIFHDDTLRPLFKKCADGIINLFFLDAAHFVMGNDFLGKIYGQVRRYFKTFSGRVRYNVLGALNFKTKLVTSVTNDSYITATQVCELLRKIAAEFVGKPVYIVLDNARYQKCKIVQAVADELKITLVYIPPYSPNLNIIERFWKHVKSKLRTKYFDQFSTFCETIDAIVGCVDIKDKEAVDSLITDKVQLFDDLVPINETTFVNKKSEAKAA
jgi:transposase